MNSAEKKRGHEEHQYYNITTALGEIGGGIGPEQTSWRRVGPSPPFLGAGRAERVRELSGGEDTVVVVGRDQRNESSDFV